MSAAEKVEALSALLGRQDTSNEAQKEQLNLQQQASNFDLADDLAQFLNKETNNSNK